MFRKILSIALVALSVPFLASGQSKTNVIDEVAWVVGDEPILLSDIERQKLYYESMGQRFEGDARCVIPEQMAIQKLFLNQAVIDSVFPNEAMIAQAVSHWITQVTNELGGREKVEEYLGRNMAQIREERRKIMREEYTVQEMQRKIIQDIKVSPSEVTRFYDRVNKDSLPYIPEMVETQIITVAPKVSDAEVDKIKERLREYTEQVQSGKYDFETLARLYSQDKGSAIQGGEIGFVGKAQLEPEFAEVAFTLSSPDKVSRIVKTAVGYHIIQLIEKRGDLINVRHILLRPDVAQEDIEKATMRLDSIAGYIKKDSLSFEDAARLASHDEDSRRAGGQMVNTSQESKAYGTSRFFMEDLPQEVARVVATLKVGEMSAPFTMLDKRGNIVVALLKLKNRIPGHRANVKEDYQTIKEIVMREKQNRELDQWIRQKQKETYVRINPAYQRCNFKYPGWIKEE